MECIGIERDNLLQEFRDIISENMNVRRMEMESDFMKLNKNVMKQKECGVQEWKLI
jgi:hypothetical protein